MTLFYMETKNNLSDRLTGPIDPCNGWPTIHPSFLVETESLEEAVTHFLAKFPNNVLIVLQENLE